MTLTDIQLVGRKWNWGEIVAEFIIILKKALPAGIQTSTFQLNKLLTIVIIGHYAGPQEMAAATLGLTFVNVTGSAVFMGLACTLDTYCSQSFTGNRKMTGVYLQKCILVSSLIAIPISMLWFQSGKIFLLLGQDPVVCQFTQRYVQFSIIGIVPNYLQIDVSKFLQSQGIFTPILLIQVALLPIYFAVQFLLVNYGLGFIGAPIGLAICDWICTLSLLVYALAVDGYQAWGGFTWQAFEKIGEYLWFSVSSVVQTCAEFWAFEIITIESGWISVNALAAQSTISNVCYTLYSLLFGVSVAASIQVGNHMGSIQPQKARLTANIAQIMAIGAGLLMGLIIYVFKYYIPYIFTKEQAVIDIIANTIPLLCLTQTVDSLQGTCSGVLRGLGKQDIGAVVNMITFYGIAIPLGYLFSFRLHQGLRGIWYGLLCGLSIQSIILSTYIAIIDFDKASKAAQSRINANELILDPLLEEEDASKALII